MFKLTVVGGPTKGAMYQVKEGELTIGRAHGNDIVLPSQKVSKRHCVLVVNNKEVTVKDNGSSNGTFVNGVLTKLKKLMPGDRVSVGEYVLELSSTEAQRSRVQSQLAQMNVPVPLALPNNVVVLPVGGGAGLNLGAPAGSAPDAAPLPQNLKEKLQAFFETYVINFVYNLNEKHEWKSMVTGMIALLTVGASLISVYPVLERVAEKLAIEAQGRAFLIARQIVDRNAPFLYEKLDSKVDVGYAEREPGVVSAYLIDMEGRVLAPGRKLNQYLTEQNEASFSSAARKAFADKEMLERKATVYGDVVAVAVPCKIFSQAAGKNVTVALGIVFFDRSTVLFDQGTEALAYIQALILSAIIGVIIFFALYRLTLRPLKALNDDIDLVLKGSASTVEKKFKMEEIEPLIDIVNAALQRASTGGGAAIGGSEATFPEESIAMLRFVAEKMPTTGLMLFSGDRKIQHINAYMEEISGIRNDSSVGADIGSVARDAAFKAFVEDIFVRASPGQQPMAEDFEFSGTTYKMESIAIGTVGGPVRGYILMARRPE